MDDERSTWLPTTAYAILGLLGAGREHTAYDVKQRADRSIAHIYWAPAMSAIYTELQRLEQIGLVAHRLEAETDARSKRVYRITAEGQRTLAEWVDHGRHEPTVIKNTTLLRVLFGARSDSETLASRLDEHSEWAGAELERLEQALAEEPASADPDESHPTAALVLEAAISSMRTEQHAVRHLAARLRAGP